jgi:hypothetical protein
VRTQIYLRNVLPSTALFKSEGFVAYTNCKESDHETRMEGLWKGTRPKRIRRDGQNMDNNHIHERSTLAYRHRQEVEK